MSSTCKRCESTNSVRSCSECGLVVCSRCDKEVIKKMPHGKSWVSGTNRCPQCGKIGKITLGGVRGKW